MLQRISPTGFYATSAYSVTELITIDGTCSLSEGSSAQTGPFSYPYLVNQQPGIGLAFAERSFFSQIGLTCSGGGVDPSVLAGNQTPITTVIVVTTIGNTTASSTSMAVTQASPTPVNLTSSYPSAPTTAPTATPSTSRDSVVSPLTAGAKIGIGVGVPLGTITVMMFGFFLWRQDRRQRLTKKAKDVSGEDSSAYLQRKAELEAEQRRHEMEAVESRREVEAGERHELQVEEPRLELKGEDHSQELEVPISQSATRRS